MDYITLGSSPSEEDCVQVGSDNYNVEARKECQRYLDLIREKMGQEPFGARLTIKSFPHDFGYYMEVVCYYDENNEEAMEYAFNCECNAPQNW